MKVCYFAVLAVLIAATAVSAQRLESVQKQALMADGVTTVDYYTINMDRIFTDTRNAAGLRTWGAPLEATQASPMSDRQLNLQWTPPAELVTATNNAALNTVTAWARRANRIVLNFSPGLAAATIDVKLEAPYLEVDPSNCATPGDTRNCRCNPADAATFQEVRPYLTDAQKIVGTASAAAGATSVPITLAPLNTFFEHAPFVGQNPFARTYRRLCYRVAGGTWQDTRVLVAVTQGCLDGTTELATDTTLISSCAAKTTNTFLTVVQNAAGTAPIFLPATTDERLGRLGDFYTTSITAPFTVTSIGAGNVGLFNGETGPMYTDRLARGTCCGASGIGIANPTETNAAAITDPRFGVCINPTFASCCGRRAYQAATEKCCSRITSRINFLDQPCDCAVGGVLTPAQVLAFCQYQGPNTALTNDNAGATQGISSPAFSCCTQSRFAEINTVTLPGATAPAFTRFQRSFCFSSAAADGFQCCSDGNVYDVGSQQCCPIAGVQSLNVPCPCGTSGDCPTGSGCCFQVFPPGLPRGQGSAQCNRFANFPRVDNGPGDSGDVLLSIPAAAQGQRCPGTCYNLNYQMCCNGAVCESGFTRCCNDTCCNKFSETCQLAQRSPLNSLSNSRDLGVYFEMCSRIELLSGRKAFFVFVLPAWLLLATAVSLALVTVLARRATEHIFELTERAIVFLALFTVVLGCPFFFSPFYKNGIVIVLIGLVAILAAVARKRGASLFLVILLVAAIFYVINPFDGNIYFSITSAVPVYGARPESSLLEAAQNLWRTSENCVAFYDFFLYDPMHRDQRLDNPEDFTFGYCSRSYITALIIFAIALYVVLLLLLLLAVFSLVKKLGIKAVEPIELEVAMEPEFVY